MGESTFSNHSFDTRWREDACCVARLEALVESLQDEVRLHLTQFIHQMDLESQLPHRTVNVLTPTPLLFFFITLGLELSDTQVYEP